MPDVMVADLSKRGVTAAYLGVETQGLSGSRCGSMPARRSRLPRPTARRTVHLVRWWNGSPHATIPGPSSAPRSALRHLNHYRFDLNSSATNTMPASEVIVGQGQDLRGFSWWAMPPLSRRF